MQNHTPAFKTKGGQPAHLSLTERYKRRPAAIITVRSIYGVRANPNFTRGKNKKAQREGFTSAMALAAYLANPRA